VGAANENPQSLGAFTYNLRLPGQYFDSETGQYNNYFRDYDAVTGRYVQSDPIGLEGGISTYAYARGNPVGRRDPLGLQDASPNPEQSPGNPNGVNDKAQAACDAEENRQKAEQSAAEARAKGDWFKVMQEESRANYWLRQYYKDLGMQLNPTDYGQDSNP
jgi:RHS repeat-associated protein